LAENPKVNLLMATSDAIVAEESALETFIRLEAVAKKAAKKAMSAADEWERAVTRRMTLRAPLTTAEVAEREVVRAAVSRRAEMFVRRMREAEEEEEEEEESEETIVKEEDEEEDEEVLSEAWLITAVVVEKEKGRGGLVSGAAIGGDVAQAMCHEDEDGPQTLVWARRTYHPHRLETFVSRNS
jgi:hypothetical protein